MMSNILHTCKNKLVLYLKQFLLLNNNFEIFKNFWLDEGGTYSGSRVSHIQREIDLHKEILEMIKNLPNILNYHLHIEYLEKRIIWLRKDIDNEQRRDFEEFFD
jgi:hypothetical protein